MKKYKQQLHKKLLENGWFLIIINEGEQWWLEEYWVIQSLKKDWGFELNVLFLVDPMDERQNKNKTISEILVTSKLPEVRCNVQHPIAQLDMFKGVFEEKLISFVEQLNKFRENDLENKTFSYGHYRTLDESENYFLIASAEDATLLDKRSMEKIEVGVHYGDPIVGIIAPDESWFLTAGEGIIYFDFQRKFHYFWRREDKSYQGKEPCLFINAARWEPPGFVRILVDPWSEQASTWLLDIEQLRLEKISDGPSLIGEPWREDVDF